MPGARRQVVVEPAINNRLAFTTVLLNNIPATFGFGNVGRLAVNMAANRLLAAGATPRYVAATATIDRDTPVDIINAVGDAMQSAAVQAEMEWTALSSEVLPQGPAQGISLSTFGVGEMPPDFTDGMRCARRGDAVIVTGPVGALGTALLAAGHGITPLMVDDGESLIDAIHALMRVVPDVHMMIYPEQGVADALAPLRREFTLDIDTAAVPVSPEVGAACRILNADPLSMATAGAMIIVVDRADEQTALDALRRSAFASQAAIVGHLV